MITIKSDEEIGIMRDAGRIAAEVLQMLVEATKAGVVEKDLDKIVRRAYAKRGVVPTFLGYHGYPATVCISINEELVHGIPDDRVIRDGDIVSIDLGATYRGFVGDTAVTFGVGEVSPVAQRLIDVTREALWQGIRAARTGARLGVVSSAIGEYIEGQGFGVVREYVGHGVGRQMHEDPQVPNYVVGDAETGPVLKQGMVIAIEPMVNVGDWRTKRDPDNWTVRTLDGSLSAHFEHTLAVRDGEAEVLTLP